MLKKEEEIFSKLNERLAEKNFYLNVICVGGYALKHYGIRETKDIDGFYNDNPEIRNIIKEIGDEFSINQEDEYWMNNSVQNLNDTPPISICKTIYKNSNLKISIPPLEYVAGMKLRSERTVDIQDVSDIITYLSITSPDVFKRKIEKYGFNDIDDSLILEAFSKAYGMEWLEEYYLMEETKLLNAIETSSRNYKEKQGNNVFSNEIDMNSIDEIYREPLRKLIFCKYEALREEFLAKCLYKMVDGKKKHLPMPSQDIIKDIVNAYKKLPDFDSRCKTFIKTKEGKEFLSSIRKYQ